MSRSIVDDICSRFDITPLDRMELDVFWGEIAYCTHCHKQYYITIDDYDHGFCGPCNEKGKYGEVSRDERRKLQNLIRHGKYVGWPL